MQRSFRNKVLKAVKNISRGQMLTYAEVARRVGAPRAARAVGNILCKNYDPAIPCHRVIRSDGRLGNYNRGGTRQKRHILKTEGVVLI